MKVRSTSGAIIPDEQRETLLVTPLHYATVQAALSQAPERSNVVIDHYTEWDETLTLTTNKVSVLGTGARNSTRITSVGTHSTGLTINGADDVLIENLNISGRGTGAGLKLTGHVRRFHAKNCRFAGGADGVLIAAAVGGQVADVLFENCVFEGTNGVHFTAGGGDPASVIKFVNCDFQYCSAQAILLDGIHATGLFVEDCNFLPQEDGSTPTKWITANVTNTTGAITGCKFADTAHASARIELADGVLYAGNFAEEGVNTARPD